MPVYIFLASYIGVRKLGILNSSQWIMVTSVGPSIFVHFIYFVLSESVIFLVFFQNLAFPLKSMYKYLKLQIVIQYLWLISCFPYVFIFWVCINSASNWWEHCWLLNFSVSSKISDCTVSETLELVKVFSKLNQNLWYFMFDRSSEYLSLEPWVLF